MGLFNKKKAEKNCCCGSSCTPEKMEQAETVKTAAGVKVLGLAVPSATHWKMLRKQHWKN